MQPPSGQISGYRHASAYPRLIARYLRTSKIWYLRMIQCQKLGILLEPPPNFSPIFKRLPTFTFGGPLFSPKQACGPEARAWCGKSIGGEKILCGDPASLPQNGAGCSGARPGAPTSGNPCSQKKNDLPARPKKRSGPHDFCAPCPCFRAGHGLKFNRLDAYLGKSEGGQVFKRT